MLEKFKGDFSNVTIVFPNKRASLFFNAAISELTDHPVWSPRFTTISELFRKASSLHTPDRILLIHELYMAYREVTKSEDNFDQFYNWGELMLTDFDDVDKHIADASKVFTLLGDIHELDSVDYLTKEQMELLKQFFNSFSENQQSELKKRFLTLWNKFNEIYTTYRNRLFAKGIAYEGMLYRDVIEHKDDINLDNRTYVFIGFNLLNTVEQEMFSLYHKAGIARFYWDFDAYYMKDNEAGKYISQYMGYYPNELDYDHETYHQFTKEKDVKFIAAPTEDLQARYIADWLTPERIKAGRRTAIVLADESLLETVLHCLPEEVEHVNITTGYPLAQTTIASLLHLTVALLQRQSYTLHNVNAILCHPFAKHLSDNVEELYKKLNSNHLYHPTPQDLYIDESLTNYFTPLVSNTNARAINDRLIQIVQQIAQHYQDKKKATDEFTNEALYRIFSILQRLSELPLEQWSYGLYQKLLMQIIQTTSIPFHGEPLDGIQIMGVLETRNLDFDHILILSCNEGNMPAKVNDSSFIPHSIRRYYELTTVENKVAIYSYYFHRMIQRSSDITVTYNVSTSDGKAHEQSRFLLQLLAESPLKISQKAMRGGQDVSTSEHSEIQKTPAMIDRLLSKKVISPSALNSYLRCPLNFYYKHIVGISDNLDGDEEQMDNISFGIIFHRAAQLIYSDHKGKVVSKSFIERLLNEKGHITIQKAVDQAFREEFFKITDDNRKTPRLGGLQVINREMIIAFIVNLLHYDATCAPFTILKLEDFTSDSINVELPDGMRNIKIGGIIDRLDAIVNSDGSQTIRVIDYKTGSDNGKVLKNVEEIFLQEKVEYHSSYYLQAFLYSNSLTKEFANSHIAPAILYVQNARREGYSPILKFEKQPITDATIYKEEYMDGLKSLIAEILNKDIPFSKTPTTNRCTKCVFRSFCKA